MRKLICVLFLISVILLTCGCSKTRVSGNAEVTLTYIYGDKDINVVLTDEEAEKVIEILNGNSYDPFSTAVPSCGFSNNISLTVGHHRFDVARDTCNTLLDCGALRYFEVSQEAIDYIHALFESYGGSFPCV